MTCNPMKLVGRIGVGKKARFSRLAMFSEPRKNLFFLIWKLKLVITFYILICILLPSEYLSLFHLSFLPSLRPHSSGLVSLLSNMGIEREGVERKASWLC